MAGTSASFDETAAASTSRGCWLQVVGIEVAGRAREGNLRPPRRPRGGLSCDPHGVGEGALVH